MPHAKADVRARDAYDRTKRADGIRVAREKRNKEKARPRAVRMVRQRGPSPTKGGRRASLLKDLK